MLDRIPETTRKWIYNVLIAAGPIITFYGLATSEEVALWIGLGATILGTPGVSVARANLSTPIDSSEGTHGDPGSDDPTTPNPDGTAPESLVTSGITYEPVAKHADL